MTEDKTHDRSSTDSVGSNRNPASADTDISVPVLGAYDVVKGTDAFIVAAADRDDAWLAVEVGGERVLNEWR